MDLSFPNFYLVPRAFGEFDDLIPVFLLHVEKIFSDKNLETHNSIL